MKKWFLWALSLLTGCSVASAGVGSAEIKPTAADSKLSGKVILTETPDGLRIAAIFENAPPGMHGFHIHENGACGDAGKAAGGHYNPVSVPHGRLSTDGFEHAHAGDFGNVEIGEQGTGKFETLIQGLTLEGGKYPVAGRAMILHEKEDDFTQPTGNAGGRIGCGLIELTG